MLKTPAIVIVAVIVGVLMLHAVSAALIGYKQPGTPPVTVTVYDGTTSPYFHDGIRAAAALWSQAEGVRMTVVNGPCIARGSNAITMCEFAQSWDGTLNPSAPCAPVYACTHIIANNGMITFSTTYLNTWAVDPAMQPSCSPTYGCISAGEAQGMLCHEIGLSLGLAEVNEYLHPEYVGCMGGLNFLPGHQQPSVSDYADLASLYPCPGCVATATPTVAPTATRTLVPTSTPCPPKGKSGRCK